MINRTDRQDFTYHDSNGDEGAYGAESSKGGDSADACRENGYTKRNAHRHDLKDKNGDITCMKDGTHTTVSHLNFRSLEM